MRNPTHGSIEAEYTAEEDAYEEGFASFGTPNAPCPYTVPGSALSGLVRAWHRGRADARLDFQRDEDKEFDKGEDYGTD